MQRNPNTFSDRAAPANYISGLGRGANSFQTSAAHGIVSMPTFGAAPSGYVAGMGRGSGGFGDKKPEAVPGTAAAKEEGGGRFDPMLGYEQGSTGFFNGGDYGTEDQYADAVYNSVDEMRSNNKKKRKAQPAAAVGPQSFKSIADDFADLKPGLKQVSVEDWSNLPEAATSLRNKKKKSETNNNRFAPVTDSLLVNMAERHTAREDLSGLSQARDQMLQVNLDRAGDAVLGQTNVDPRSLLTELSGQLDASSQLGDVKKARLLLKSVTSTNPVHGPGWIAAARVEEIAGKLPQAREIMRNACEACADQEDVWLEASRLEPSASEAKAVLIKAVSRHLPKSVALWLAAADLEITMEEAVQRGLARKDAIGSFKRITIEDMQAAVPTDEAVLMQILKRKQLINQALGRIPDSIKLWQQAIAIEMRDSEAQQLLLQAKMACPEAVDFYLASARLESEPQQAQKLLNEARKRFPGEIRIWIAACRLVEEQQPSATLEHVSGIVSQAVKRIAAAQAHVDRQVWLKQAEECEVDGYPLTCKAVLRQSLGMNIDPQDRFPTWRADAAKFESHHYSLCAKICSELLVETFKDNREAWDVLIRSAATQEKRLSLLQRAVQALPNCELFWLMLAKETWKSPGGGVRSARAVLDQGFQQCANAGEEMWFAAAKLAGEESLEEARQLLQQARETCGEDSDRVWIKSAVHERRMKDAQREKDLCLQALQQFPRCEKLHLMLGQVLELESVEEAKQSFANGVEVCPKSVALWLNLARVEEELGNSVRARAVLDNARSRISTSPMLWLAAIRLERRLKSPESTVQNYLARALQHFPNDGSLLVEQVDVTPEAKKQAMSELAFKRTQGKDAQVILCCAKLWWRKRPMDAAKVKRWLDRAVMVNPKFGDAWAALYKFMLEQQQQDEAEAVVKQCCEAVPSQGERWIRVSKGRGNEHLTVEHILKLVAKDFSVLLEG